MAKLSEIGAQWRFDRSGARARIVEAFGKSSGNVVHAAKALGLSHRQLLRYVGDDTTLREALDKARTAKPATV